MHAVSVLHSCLTKDQPWKHLDFLGHDWGKITSRKGVHLSSLPNNGRAGPSSLNTAVISYFLVHLAGSTMENPPFTISNGSSFVGFPSLLEASVVNKSNNGSKGGGHNLNRSKLVSNKVLPYGAGLSSQTEENTASDEAICNRAGLSLKNEGLTTMDVLHNSMNTEEGLSYVASAVGNPLYADSLTETMKRILYVRICVEIDATSNLIDSFDLLMGEGDEHNNGENVEILVEYQWKPKIFLECKSFGHNAATCPSLKHVEGISDENRCSKMKQEWVKVEEASKNGGGQPNPISICISEDVPITGLSSTSEASSRKKKKRNSKVSMSSKVHSSIAKVESPTTSI
ncbi:hypothetical protein Dsin_029148 [Dipteronia sinensis]|uniref:DUF4283 domain-containing protein n=1 Tax=Dipteronia sinensis TaxID=43782 RepID=A0AAD9ZS47_9ROSI|nr:hypothetical protein Dsin_029148 [Dipteronia sinensis]